MYSFIKPQTVVEVGGVRFGGQPGENPTVLFGTLFYGKEFKVLNDSAYELAKQYLNTQEKISEETGVPGIVDLYLRSGKDVKAEVDFLLGETDGPFALDSSEASTRIEALKYLAEKGVLDRVIYNSINLGVSAEEVKALKAHPPASAIILAYNPRDMSVEGRMDILNKGAGMVSVGEGLIEVAEKANIKGILLDTGATPFGAMSCETLRAIPVFKNHFGLPVGCSIHNTLESWSWMKDRRGKDKLGYDCANASANCLVPLCSGDYIVYGPIKSAPQIFPAIAFTDKLVAEGAKDYFGAQPSEKHPYNRLR